MKENDYIFFLQPYFCGQDAKCSVIKNEWALENAKANIEKWYPVIGTLEDLETTFFVLENKLPQFFKGISRIYFDELKGKILIWNFPELIFLIAFFQNLIRIEDELKENYPKKL